MESVCKQAVRQQEANSAPKASENLSEKDKDEPSAFIISTKSLANYVTVNPDQSTVLYTLHDSFILDSRATIHCCNIQEQFYNLTSAATDDILISGND